MCFPFIFLIICFCRFIRNIGPFWIGHFLKNRPSSQLEKRWSTVWSQEQVTKVGEESRSLQMRGKGLGGTRPSLPKSLTTV